jgi:phosphotransferase system HPr (HPr) family protein
VKQGRVTVLNPTGLHARPAALFVAAANRFTSTLQVRNVTRNSPWANAKSILSVLTLGVEQHHEIEITAEGPDEDQALGALVQLIASDFAGTP